MGEAKRGPQQYRLVLNLEEDDRGGLVKSADLAAYRAAVDALREAAEHHVEACTAESRENLRQKIAALARLESGELMMSGPKPGDRFLLDYLDEWGEVAWDEYVVDAVEVTGDDPMFYGHAADDPKHGGRWTVSMWADLAKPAAEPAEEENG